MWKLLSLLAISLVALLLLVNAVWGSFPGGFAMPAIILLVIVALLLWRHLRPMPVPVVEASSAVVVVRPMQRPPFPNVSAEMVTPEKDAAPEVEVALLTANDRCDAIGCGSRAWVRVIMSSLFELQFCAHDWERHGAALEVKAAAVIDERHLILGA